MSAAAPTTVVVARTGRIWFTESNGNRIGSMNPDGSDLQEYPLPHPDSGPRILARGSDGNLWFSEHTGNRIARITQNGNITEWDIPTANSQPRAIALGADGNIWFGMFAAGKIGRITPAGVLTEFVVADGGQWTPRTCSGDRWQRLVLGIQSRKSRSHHAQGRHHRILTAAPQERPR